MYFRVSDRKQPCSGGAEEPRYGQRIVARVLLVLVLGAVGTAPRASGQQIPNTRDATGDPRFGSDSPESASRFRSGVELLITNSGFAVGGYVRDSVNVHYALTGELSIGSIKDEREDAFFNRIGERSIPGKANYLLVLPGRIGVQRRLFSNTIHDSFRPFVQVTVGPTVGWLYPYFDDCNANGTFDPDADCDNNGIQEEGEGESRLGKGDAIGMGSVRLGGGGSIGLGAYIRYGTKGARGFRISYAFDYFGTPINLLETDIQAPKRFYGTPSIVVFFGHLF